MSTEQRDKAALVLHEAKRVRDRLVREANKPLDIEIVGSMGQMIDLLEDAHAATMPDRGAVEKVLRANGLSDEPAEFDSNIHSWRCGHPDIYGKCSCFQELAAELLALLNKED